MNEANQPQAERPHQERTKPLSWVWAYFKPTEIGGVRYNVCHAPISPGSNELCLKRMIPDKSGGTKSMGNHLERKHRLSKSDPPPLTPITVSLGPPSNSGIGSSKRRLNRDTLMTGITKFLIANNLPSQTIDNQQFIELLHLCNPLITRPLLFDPDTLTQFIHHKYMIAKQALKERLAKLTTTTKLSFSCTRYSPSDRNHSLIALVVHWISDQEATLINLPLGLLQLNRSPSCQNIAHAILQILTDFDLQERIFSLTIDNVPDLGEFGRTLASLIPDFNPDSQLIGCMGSLINQSAELVLKDFFPPNSTSSSTSDIHDTVDNNTTAPHTVHVSSILSRLQDLTLFLRQSSQKNESFNRIVSAVTSDPQAGLAVGSINQTNSSRWNSTYHIMTRAYHIKEAIQIFCLKEVGAAQFNIHDQEWDLVRQICDFLKPMNIAANEISADKPCDMITATPTFCWLLRRLNKVRKNYEGRELMEPIKEMLERLTVYQESTKQKSVHIFAMILDPRIKMSNFEDHSHNNNSTTTNNPDQQQKIDSRSQRISLEEIQKSFHEASIPYSPYPIFQNDPMRSSNGDMIVNPLLESSSQNHQTNPTTHHHHHHHHHPHHHHKRSRNQQSNQASESDSDSDYESGKPRIFKKKPKLMIGLKDEITNYLGTDCEESNCNPLEFWKSNSSKFPTLFGMSKDFLQVQASTGSALNICEKFHLLSEAFLSGGSSTSFSLNPNNHPPPTHNTNSNKHLHSRDMSNPGHFMNLPTNSSQTTGTTPHNNNISTDSMFGIHPQIAGGTPSSSSSQPPPSSTTTNNQSSARSTNGYNQAGYGLSFQPSIPTIEKDIIVHPPPSSSSNIPIDPSIPTTVTSISTPVPPTSNNNNPPPPPPHIPIINPALIDHHHQHQLSSFLPLFDQHSLPTPALDSLDSFALSNSQFVACSAHVCLFYWSFVLGFVDL
ncbi:hypothetical protein Pst134EB_033159 [Puccinia striiformis f. sp. tritici]|nr:hypothetical protein Pst134EB_033159 [Puccinia striiformis f. sp. tritici]